VQHIFPVLLVLLSTAMLTAMLQSRLPGRLARLVIAGWAAQVAGVVANLAVTILVYHSGDALNYHRQGSRIAGSARMDPFVLIPELFKSIFQLDSLVSSSIEGTDATATMVASVALLCLILWDSLYAVSLLVGMGSFFGKVLLFMGIRRRFSVGQQPYVLGAILFVPSAVFWTGGIIKESVVLFGLGLAIWGGAELVRRSSIPAGAAALAGLMIVGLVKSYILLTAVVAYGVYLYWQGAVRRGVIEIKPVRLVLGGVVAIGGIIAVGSMFPRMSIANLAQEMSHLQDVGNRGGSGYSIGAGADASLAQQLFFAPLALVTSLYRPFLFEVRNPQMLVSALETTAGLVLSLRAFQRYGLAGLKEVFVRRPFLMFCLVFAVLTGVGVGLASANLGTLARYRAPLVPFFAILLAVTNAPSAVRRPSRVAVPRRRMVA